MACEPFYRMVKQYNAQAIPRFAKRYQWSMPNLHKELLLPAVHCIAGFVRHQISLTNSGYPDSAQSMMFSDGWQLAPWNESVGSIGEFLNRPYIPAT
eukprot:3924823-Pleurochrysis_carterae.AAC.1